MTDTQREFEEWQKQEAIHGGFTSKRDFDAGYQAGLAQAEAEINSMSKQLQHWKDFSEKCLKLSDKKEAEKAELVRQCAEITKLFFDCRVEQNFNKWDDQFGSMSLDEAILSILPKE